MLFGVYKIDEYTSGEGYCVGTFNSEEDARDYADHYFQQMDYSLCVEVRKWESNDILYELVPGDVDIGYKHDDIDDY